MKNKITAFILSLFIIASHTSAVSADTAQSDTLPNSSWTEKTDRGLVAVPVNNGIYLSWRLYENEDKYFGSSNKNISFDIYRNGKKIALETRTTNYIDTDGKSTDTYRVVRAYNTISADNKTVSVNAANEGLTAYAAKYNGTMLEK